MTNLFKERLKAAETSPTNALMPSERPSEAITFQQQSPTGSFVRTVTAYPGTITLVQEKSKTQSFREALLGNERNTHLSIRSGSQEMHRTEVTLAGSSAHILEARTVFEALRKSGAPEARVREILREIGLEGVADAAPNTLNAQMLKRLAIAASLFHRARIVHLDRPFTGVDQAWVERLARLLVEAGELPTRVLLITGEAKIPAVWKDHPRVVINNVETSSAEMAVPTQKAVSAGLQNLARTMLSAGALLRDPTAEIITRPQMIYPAPRPAGREALQSEAITNPHVDLPDAGDTERLRKTVNSVEAVQAEKRGRDAEEATHSSRRTPSGKLTRVTRVLRLQQSAPVNVLKNTAKKIRQTFAAPAREEALLPPVKRTMVQVKNLKRRRFIVGASALVVVLYGLWILGAIHYRQSDAARGGQKDVSAELP